MSMNKLEKYTREELEKKILHMTAFMAHKLATEYLSLSDPTFVQPIRTAEAEQEYNQRILEYMVCIYPAWDVVESTHDGYDIMKEWITKNHDNTLLKPCICDGCKVESDKIN